MLLHLLPHRAQMVEHMGYRPRWLPHVEACIERLVEGDCVNGPAHRSGDACGLEDAIDVDSGIRRPVLQPWRFDDDAEVVRGSHREDAPLPEGAPGIPAVRRERRPGQTE